MEKTKMRKPTVHIVIRNGIVEEAYAEGCNPDVVVYDLDCPPGDMREEIERAVAQLPKVFNEVEIY
jgi:uncharacterized Rossmann fold enzyme